MEFKNKKSDYFNYKKNLNSDKCEVCKEKIDESLQKFRDEVTEKVTRDLEDLFDAFISDVGQISQADGIPNGSLTLSSAINRYVCSSPKLS